MNHKIRIGLKTQVNREIDNEIIISEKIIANSEANIKLTYEKFSKNYASLGDFFTWLGIAITFLTALCTSNFENIDFLNLNKDQLKIIFIFLLLFSTVVTLYTLFRYILYKIKYNTEKFISEIKNVD